MIDTEQEELAARLALQRMNRRYAKEDKEAKIAQNVVLCLLALGVFSLVLAALKAWATQ